MKDKHKDLYIRESGLWINPMYPHLGASPDGIVSCICCGVGVIEIKCPYCKRNDTLCDTSDSKGFCVETLVDGTCQLSRNHSYYYQVQTQIFVCDEQFADFVVWSQKDIHIERVYRNEDFWATITTQAHCLFQSAILPELVAKYYSRRGPEIESSSHPVVSSAASKNPDDEVWCLCREKEHGTVEWLPVITLNAV